MENIEWGKLGFNYYKTAYNVRFHYADGKWGRNGEQPTTSICACTSLPPACITVWRYSKD